MSADRLVPLPGGQSAELRPADEVPERLRRPISRALRRVRPEMMQEIARVNGLPGTKDDASEEDKSAVATARAQLSHDLADEEVDALSEANDLGIVALVAHWSYGTPITLENVLDLPGRAYDKLRDAVGPLVNDLFVDASPDPNPTAPTADSNGSGASSTESLALSLPSTGAPTA